MADTSIDTIAFYTELASDVNVVNTALHPGAGDTIPIASLEEELDREAADILDCATLDKAQTSGTVDALGKSVVSDIFEANRCRRDYRIVLAGHRELIRSAMNILNNRTQYLTNKVG